MGSEEQETDSPFFKFLIPESGAHKFHFPFSFYKQITNSCKYCEDYKEERALPTIPSFMERGRSSFITPYKQSEIMGDISKDPLYEILQQMDCHFTWTLLEEDIDLDELEGRIADQIKFLVGRVQHYNLLAYVKYLNGKKEEALEILQKAEENVKIEDPEEVEKASLVTWGNYAWMYYLMGKLTEAQTYINKVESTCKENGSASPYRMEPPQESCERGWAQLTFGQNYAAKESFAKALEKDPENAEFNSGYATSVYHLEKEYEKRSAAVGSSLELLKKAAKLNPDDAFVLSFLALKLQETRKVEEGEELIEEALGKHPGLPYVLRYAAIFYRKKGDVERSLELLKEALSLTPNSGFLHHQMGLCYRAQYFKIKLSEDPHKDKRKMAELIRLCIFHFKEVVEHKTKFVYAHLDLANMYAEGKELQKAEETFQEVFAMRKLTCEEKQQLHFNYGHFLENHKNSKSEAVEHYLAGLRIENESFERNKCKWNLKMLIEKRIKEGPADTKSLGIRAFIHQLDGEKQQAIECYEQALETDPENEEYSSVLLELRLSVQSEKRLYKILQQLECHFTWAVLMEDMDRDELEGRIATKTEHLLSNIGIYNLLAYVKFLNGKKEEALENLQRAEEAVKIEYPEEVKKASLVTWGNYAWVYYHMGKLTEAQTYINKVETTCKENGSASPYRMERPQTYYEKGWAQLMFGQNYTAEAKESFAKALEKEPENPEFNSSYAITVYRLEDFYGKKSAAEGSSLEPLKKAAKLDPDNALVLSLLALKLQQTNNTEEGGKYIKEALEKHPSSPYVLGHAAIFFRKKGDIERALELLKEVLSLTPNSGFLHHQMGLCYRAQYLKIKSSEDPYKDRRKMAELIRLCIFHFEEVVERKTKFVYAHLDLANMYAEGKELQKAEETFQKVFTMRKLTCSEEQQLHFNYGRFQEYHKKSESEAVEHYLTGLRIEIKSFAGHQCKCYLKKLIEKKIKRGTTNAKSFGIRGFIHQLDEEKHQAIECYERALEMDPDNEEYISALLELKFSVQS
ncbi:interferon-induced protein with tetratricopeptide repeats 5-like [Podarcis lilfordi]|uniref:Interferon-induced protein with tetratricopeptide repeats 5-like n=1 Tax=Podarcis lilfordi TaxID=74358 RepID=A0AA35KD65_9SAUR|nr:interferon-induced protein with tetratricopeptide repeats 5-like [Podarcis lilfordi]